MRDIRYPSKSLEEVLAGLAGYSESQFQTLLDEIRGDQGFSRTAARRDALSEKLGLDDPDDVYLLLSAIDFVYSKVHEVLEEGDDVNEVVQVVLSALGDWDGRPQEFEKTGARLAELVEYNAAVYGYRKLEHLQTDILQNGVGFSSFVDLRPDFRDDRTRIERLVPIVIFRVSTDNDEERSFVFQMTEQSLANLKKAVQAAEEKLRTVRSSEILTNMLAKKDP